MVSVYSQTSSRRRNTPIRYYASEAKIPTLIPILVARILPTQYDAITLVNQRSHALGEVALATIDCDNASGNVRLLIPLAD
jgi:hypothetical protein